MKAVVLGGSGGAGRGIVRALAACPNYDKVTLLGRKEMDLGKVLGEAADLSKFDQKTLDFSNIPGQASLVSEAGCDTAFYAIGVSSTAVSEEEYKRIEHDNALALASMLKEGGCSQVHWITGNRTSSTSSFAWARIKAQVEEEVGKMGFTKAYFYRPSAILTSDGSASSGLGPRAGNVVRALDRCHWISVEADLMGRVMVHNSLQEAGEESPVKVFENKDINTVGSKLP